jgi:hypothetical protein
VLSLPLSLSETDRPTSVSRTSREKRSRKVQYGHPSYTIQPPKARGQGGVVRAGGALLPRRSAITPSPAPAAQCSGVARFTSSAFGSAPSLSSASAPCAPTRGTRIQKSSHGPQRRAVGRATPDPRLQRVPGIARHLDSARGGGEVQRGASVLVFRVHWDACRVPVDNVAAQGRLENGRACALRGSDVQHREPPWARVRRGTCLGLGGDGGGGELRGRGGDDGGVDAAVTAAELRGRRQVVRPCKQHRAKEKGGEGSYGQQRVAGRAGQVRLPETLRSVERGAQLLLGGDVRDHPGIDLQPKHGTVSEDVHAWPCNPRRRDTSRPRGVPACGGDKALRQGPTCLATCGASASGSQLRPHGLGAAGGAAWQEATGRDAAFPISTG